MASSSAVGEIASTIQSASINRHPSPAHDANPSTTASTKEPVYVSTRRPSTQSSVDTDVVPLSAIRPAPRTSTLPPLPDLRFEQSYLKSLEGAQGWIGIGWITTRDQILLPLVQGLLWTLILSGWRHWNRRSKLSGNSAGARVRRWWWNVNNWDLPGKHEAKVEHGMRKMQRT
jgi:hypothetical protein